MKESKSITFDTKYVGPLHVEKNGEGYTMDFPSRPGNRVELDQIPPFVLDALSNERPVEAYQSRDLMLVYEDENIIPMMKPNYHVLREYQNFIIVTAKSKGPYDFISRFFCAEDGVDEDPVTGSAHSTLAPYWAQKLGKDHLKAYQISSRGGSSFSMYQKIKYKSQGMPLPSSKRK